MAGRPKRMAAKATRLSGEALRLWTGIFDAMPRYYLNHPDSNGPFCPAWNEAFNTTHTAMLAIEHLAKLLRNKAGLDREACLAMVQRAIEREAKAKKVTPPERGTEQPEPSPDPLDDATLDEDLEDDSPAAD